MSKYIWDKVLEPPSAVLTIPMPDDPKKHSEKYDLDLMFKGGLPASALVRYRQNLAGDHRDPFLCFNWARHRIEDDLVKNKPFPKEPEEGTTDYDAAEMETELNAMGLVACDDNDKDRMILLWAIKNDHPKSRIGHIQVRPNGSKQWESKLSHAQWVICHEELSIEDFLSNGPSSEPLVRAVKGKRYYKRKKTMDDSIDQPLEVTPSETLPA